MSSARSDRVMTSSTSEWRDGATHHDRHRGPARPGMGCAERRRTLAGVDLHRQVALRLDEGPLHEGARATITQPRLPKTEYVVTELQPGRSFTWVAKAPGVFTTARHDLEPLPGGGTRVRLSVAQSGWLGSVMGRFCGSSQKRV